MTDAGQNMLPYGRQLIDDEDIEAVVRVLRGDWLTTGPAVAGFEAELCRITGAAHGVSCANGTAALHLAALALELSLGDIVVVPAVTFLATANAVRLVGAEVALADVDPDTGLLDPSGLRAAIERVGSDRVKAVFPVHLNGQTADMPAISEVARELGINVVEDACHALGGGYEGAVGTTTAVGGCAHSDMTVFSFHPVKTIAMGEGGAVMTNSDKLADSMRRMRNHGMIREPDQLINDDLAWAPDGSANPWYYEMHQLGLNYRASDINCALGLSQLKKLRRFVDRRGALVARYDTALKPLSNLLQPIRRQSGCQPAWHLYVVQIDFEAMGQSRAEVMTQLRARNIGTQVHYMPLHLQPYYRKRYGALSLPGAEAYYAGCLSLPLHAGMADEDVDRVVATLAEVLDQQ
jgi:UDP-4-amino-4,6-dideoxy-N-acetyl-beta-L-altrosamine transaminase